MSVVNANHYFLGHIFSIKLSKLCKFRINLNVTRWFKVRKNAARLCLLWVNKIIMYANKKHCLLFANSNESIPMPKSNIKLYFASEFLWNAKILSDGPNLIICTTILVRFLFKWNWFISFVKLIQELWFACDFNLEMIFSIAIFRSIGFFTYLVRLAHIPLQTRLY